MSSYSDARGAVRRCGVEGKGCMDGSEEVARGGGRSSVCEGYDSVIELKRGVVGRARCAILHMTPLMF